MRRVRITVLLLALGSLIGCVDHDSASLIVIGHASVKGASCELPTANSSTPVLTVGGYNVAFGNPYILIPLVQNRLVSRNAELAVNPNDVRLIDAEIQLLDDARNPIPTSLPNPYTVPADGLIASDNGFGLTEIVAIPESYRADVAAHLANQGGATAIILLEVQLIGETIGEVEVISEPWTYRVEVGSDSFGFGCAPPGSSEGNIFDGCLPGQDHPVNGCLFLESAAQCGARCDDPDTM